MAKSDIEQNLNISVVAEKHSINVVCGSRADEVNQRFKLAHARNLLEAVRQEEPPFMFKIGGREIELKEKSEQSRLEKELVRAIAVASKVVLHIDSPISLRNQHQINANKVFCSWPEKVGGKQLIHGQHRDDGNLRDYVEFEFSESGYPNGLELSLEKTRNFFANWKDNCVGDFVEVTVRNEERDLETFKIEIGNNNA